MSLAFIQKIFQKSSDPFNYLFSAQFAHSAVHRDTIVQAQDYATGVSAARDYLIVAPAGTHPHMVFDVSATANTRVQFFEGATVSANGTAITKARLNRTSETTTVTNIYQGPTVTTTGTELPGGFIAAGTGALASGSVALHDDGEWLLKEDTNYLVRVTPAASAIMSVRFEWYE